MNGLVDEFRSKKFREKGAELGKKVVFESMMLKIQDEREKHRELQEEKCDVRRETETIYGKNSRRQRRLIKHLIQEASRTKHEEKEKYESKLQHQEWKKRKEEEDRLAKMPPGLEKY
jgi:hypothetical protein